MERAADELFNRRFRAPLGCGAGDDLVSVCLFVSERDESSDCIAKNVWVSQAGGVVRYQALVAAQFLPQFDNQSFGCFLADPAQGR